MTFAIGTILSGDVAEPAIRVAGQAYLLRDLSDLTGPLPATTLGLFQNWNASFAALAVAAKAIASGSSGASRTPEAQVHLGKPLTPTKCYCVGANYADHLIEMGAPGERMEGKPPFWYLKPPSTAVCGPGETVEIPRGCEDFDWEGEVVVVFGKGGKAIAAQDALSHVAGYTMGIDFTARDQFPVPHLVFGFHFGLGKCQDNTAPIGPWIVPQQFLDGTNMDFGLSVNGSTKQSSNTTNMLWTIAEQIEEVSRRITIEAGDILFTGTPAGVGAGRGERLAPGDRVVASGECIGDLSVIVKGYAPDG